MAPKPNTKSKCRTKVLTEEEVNEALADIAAGQSIRSVSRRCGMSGSGLRKRRDMLKEGKLLMGSGRRPCLDKTHEQELARCIGTICQLGFSPTRAQIKDIVQEFVRLRQLDNPFKDDRPGKGWLRGFMVRNGLSLKKANMISAARKSATANPFIIYDFYEIIEKIIKERKLERHQIWNCDESGFPTDPQKCKVVGVKGEECYKVTCGAGRENITTLAVCNAAGRALDPLIIFAGKNLQSSWRGENPLPKTFYGVSDSGWMTTQIFAQWFTMFAKEVKERPLMLLLDGHLTHMSFALVDKALKEDIIIVKLPPHSTDLLQPLDVSCFGPLKREWERELNQYIYERGPKQPMKKPTFVDLLSKIWHEGLCEENIVCRISHNWCISSRFQQVSTA